MPSTCWTREDLIVLIAGALRFAGKGKSLKPTECLVSPRNVNSQVETLRAVYRRADRLWTVHIGDMPDWQTHLLPVPDERVRELTAEEEPRLFERLRPDFHPMARFALASRLRLANVHKLRWSQIDLEAGVIALKVKSRKHAGGRVHALPITREMAAILGAERGRHSELVFTYVVAHSGKGRRKGDRRPFTANGWRKAWWAALEASGIEDLRFHDLRHTRATRSLRRSNLKVVQKLLGHADIASTDRYAHAELDDVRAALEDDAPAPKAEGERQ